MFSVAVNMNIYILSRFDRGVSDIPVTRCRYYVIKFLFSICFLTLLENTPKYFCWIFLFVFERGLKGQNIGE